MTIDERAIEECLASTNYHPDCVPGMELRVDALAESLKDKDTDVIHAGIAELRSLANDVVLMQRKYFTARVRFLSKLVQYLNERPEANMRVADDGCGTGADLYVLDTLLGKKLSLTGTDVNEASLAVARQRVSNAEFAHDFGGKKFDIIYSDFFSAGNNTVVDIADRAIKNLDALRSPGVVLHNADMRQLSLYCRFFGAQFSRVLHPELLAHIDDYPDCYLCRFEKD